PPCCGWNGPPARHRRDQARRVDLADPEVLVIGDVDVPRAVDRRLLGREQLGTVGRAAVAGESAVPGPSEGRDDACRVDLANCVVRLVGDVEVAASVAGDTARGAQLGVRGGAAVTAVALAAVPGDRRE